MLDISFKLKDFHGLVATLWLVALTLLFFLIGAVALIISSALASRSGAPVYRQKAFAFFLAAVVVSLLNVALWFIFTYLSPRTSLAFKDAADAGALYWFLINLPLYFVLVVPFAYLPPETTAGRYLVTLLTAVFCTTAINILFMVGFFASQMILFDTPFRLVYLYLYEYYISWFYALNLILLVVFTVVAKRKLFG